MQLHVIHAGMFKLDGGAMFGVIPQKLWKKANAPDEANLCSWAMRCLLVEDGDRLVLIDTGMGDKQDDKFFSIFKPHGPYSLLGSLRDKGFSPDDITDVFLTHLHFDHVGGAVKREGERFVPAFKNATYWSNRQHWDWAMTPNAREKASYLKENFLPLQESGQLQFLIPGTVKDFLPFDAYFVDGHTEQQMLPKIEADGQTVIFCADLCPSAGHVPLPWIMAYDMQPLKTLAEKEAILGEAVEKGHTLFFQHDPVNECGTAQLLEGRGIRLKDTFDLKELVN